jgi:hypothetical protein
LYCISPHDKDQCVLGFFPMGKVAKGLITHLCSASRLRMSGAVLLCSLHLNGVDRNNFTEFSGEDDIRCMLK